MLDDVLGEVAESVDLGPGSKAGQRVVRLVFGLVGVVLSGAGVYSVTLGGLHDAGLHFKLAAALVFLALGAFCLCNVALYRQWRWPGRLFVLSFVGLFLTRIFLGP